jgi:7-cyano-7-deazaguanine synthase
MPTAVLCSGGLDSAVLLAEEAARGAVQPMYVSTGLAWEPAERAMLAALLACAPFAGTVQPVIALSVDMRDVYAATHWAVQGTPPAYHTPDEDVYLPGRNIILLGKAAVSCAAARIDRLVVGTLAHNPFPDATPQFRDAMARALSLGLAHTLRVDAPFAGMSKADVIRRGIALGVPFALTLSCMNPGTGRSGDSGTGLGEKTDRDPAPTDRDPAPIHCGLCSKCRERHDAFLEAAVTDPTAYVDSRFVRA